MAQVDPRKQAQRDQAVEGFVESTPKILKRLFDGLLEEGFNKGDAMELCKHTLFGLVAMEFNNEKPL